MNNRLCRFAVSGLLATSLTFSTAAVFAQQDNAPPAPDASAQQPPNGQMNGPMNGPMNGQGRMGRAPMDPDEQVAHMTKRYHLSADQQTQIKPILVSQQQQMMALRQDTSSSRDDKMAKMKGIHDDSSTKIQAILDDGQKQKFAADQQKMQERRQERMQGQGGPAAGGPPNQ